jgi:hypothetical protein
VILAFAPPEEEGVMAKNKRNGRNGRRRNHTESGAHAAAPRRRTAVSTFNNTPGGIVRGVLRTLAVLTVGTVEVTQAVLTSTIRGAVTVVQEAVDGVRTIGSDVIGAGSSGRRSLPGRGREDERRAA